MVDVLSPVVTFANHVTRPSLIDARTGGAYTIAAVQVSMNLGIGLDAGGQPLLTTMWTYALVDANGQVVATGDPGMAGMDMGGPAGLGQPSPMFLTSSGVPISVTWMNVLPMTGYLLPVDTSLMAGMSGASMPMAPTTTDGGLVPLVVHLHGGHTAAIFDGFPTSVSSQMDAPVTYVYDNSQQAALIWYHDHSIGTTRITVYSGLAGLYMIEDANRRNLVATGVLPETLGANDTPLLIQDKSFTTDGQLYYPGAAATDPLPGTTDTVADVLPPDYSGPFPTAVPEYFGNVIMVNGQAWPHAHVGQGDVEYDLTNGSDSRFYVMRVDNPWVKVTLLGVDGGLLPKPITIVDGDGVDEAGEQFVLAPADRLQLLFDFSDPHLAPGTKVHLLNVGPAYEPFKGLLPDGSLEPGVDDVTGGPVPVQAATVADPVGQIMEFRVSATVPAWHSTLTPDTVLDPGFHAIDPDSASLVRRLGVFEVEDEFGRIMPMVGVAAPTVDNAGNVIDGTANGFERGYDTPVTEIVTLGATEIWEFFNTTADAHPMHVHSGSFQVLGRYAISATDGDGDGVLINGYNNDLGDLIDTRADLPGIQNLYPEDTGGQDTVWLGPGEAIRIIMTFDRPGDYLWHCHIVSHEDHDMMRAFKVVGVSGDFLGDISEDSTAAAAGLVEIGTADPMQQGFVAGTFTGRYGTLSLAQDLTLSVGADLMPRAPVAANDGQWSYGVDARAQALAEGEAATEHFTITALDGSQYGIDVTVHGHNDAPVVAGSVLLPRLAENASCVVTARQLLAGATDVDHGAVLGVKQLVASSGLLQDNGDLSWTYIPDVNATGPVTFSYLVSDGMVDVAASASLTIDPGCEFQVITGTDRDDVLRACSRPAYERGEAGDDRLLGGAGNDVMLGGTGHDTAFAGAGNDVFVATVGDGNDRYDGQGGTDTYDLSRTAAGASVNLMTGKAGSAETGADRLVDVENVVGSAGEDTLAGNTRANRLEGRAGNDLIDGGAGNDTIAGGGGNDTLVGGAGRDSFVFAAHFGADTIRDFQAGVGCAAADVHPHDFRVRAHDVLDLRDFSLASFDAFLDHVTDTSAGAMLTLDDSTLLLAHVTKAQISAVDVVLS